VKSRVITYIKHYIFGLLASCWNAGISAVKISGGIGVAAAAAPKLITALDLHTMLGVFIAAVFWEAIDYFNDHKLPTNPAGLGVAPTP
jgi:hypothetical protein